MLVKSLNTLQISAGEDNGEWGAQFPKGVAIFVPEGNLTLQTRAVALRKPREVMNPVCSFQLAVCRGADA